MKTAAMHPLKKFEMCYVELEWIPIEEGELSAELLLNASSGGELESFSLAVPGIAQSLGNFGDSVEMPDADFDTDHEQPWNVTESDAVEGDNAMETEFDSDDSFWLTGDFDNSEDMVLSFYYLLEGASCLIYLDDTAIYELSNSEKWEEASVTVPAGSSVKWEFTPYEKAHAGGTVRMDNFRQQPGLMSSAASESSSINSEAGSVATVAPSAESGASGYWLLSLLGLAGVARRRKGDLIERATV